LLNVLLQIANKLALSKNIEKIMLNDKAPCQECISSEGKCPRILKTDNRWGRVFSLTLRQFYPS
jgi:hypothetical protein